MKKMEIGGIKVKVFIFGAECGLGKHLIEKLKKQHEVYINNSKPHSDSINIPLNVFLVEDLKNILNQMDKVIYITHKSALPSAYLQGDLHYMHVWAIENIQHVSSKNNNPNLYILNTGKLHNANFEHTFNSQKVKVVDVTSSNLIDNLNSTVQFFKNKSKKVYSFQYLTLQKLTNARQLVNKYEDYLKKTSFELIQVDQTATTFDIRLKGLSYPLIKLEKVYCSPTQFILKVTGGLLVNTKQDNKATFEFRITRNHLSCVTALCHFKPALPWWLYLISQAQIHKWVMVHFTKYI